MALTDVDFERLRRSKELRNPSFGRPFDRFYKLYLEVHEIEQLATEANDKTLSPAVKWILQKHSVITLVTGIEVYFREALNLIFCTCRANTFEGFLKDIHRGRYDIEDIVALYRKGTNPLELVVDGCNFQNFDEINSVFSKVTGKPFWTSIQGLQVRLKDRPDTEMSFDKDHMKALQATLALRHELIHNPDLSQTSLTDDQRMNLHLIATLVLGCDILFTNHINANLDDELRQKRLANGKRDAAPNPE